MLPNRYVAPAVVVFVTVLGCGSQDRSPSPSAPSPQPATPVSPTPPPAPKDVTHTLTMTASASCTSLPAVATTRTYPAQLQEKTNGDLLVLVVNSYDIMIGWANDSGFTGTRAGNTVHFDLTDDLFGPYAIIERIPGVGDMGYAGAATGTIDDNHSITAVFSGEFRLGYGRGPVPCAASDHRIDVTPIGK